MSVCSISSSSNNRRASGSSLVSRDGKIEAVKEIRRRRVDPHSPSTDRLRRAELGTVGQNRDAAGSKRRQIGRQASAVERHMNRIGVNSRVREMRVSEVSPLYCS